MATVMQFVAEDLTTVRLDLNSSSGWVLARGLNLGSTGFQAEWLSQAPYDGAIPAGTHRPNVEMTVPLTMHRQVSAAALKALFDSLATELDRETNIIKYQPHGWPSAYILDTYRSPIPSLFRGQDAPTAAHLLVDPKPMEVTIFRHPKDRAGNYI